MAPVRSPYRSDRGSVSVEAVLLAPVLVAIALFVVHLGRIGAANTRLVAAADHAARAASLVHPRTMEGVARNAALENLLRNGLSCESVTVDVMVPRTLEPRIVQVELACVLDRSGLALLAPLPRRLEASSSEVVDRWRVDS